MRPLDCWLGAARMIVTYRLRSAFAILGTGLGVTFLIAVLTLVRGMDEYMKHEVAGRMYGFNTVMLRQAPADQRESTREERREWERRAPLTREDARWLEGEIDFPVLVATQSVRPVSLRSERGNWSAEGSAAAVSSSYFLVRELLLESGREFTDIEEERGARVVVLGAGLADALFEGRPAVGGTVRIRGTEFQVIGVLAREEEGMESGADALAFVPTGTLPGFSALAGEVDEIIIKAEEAEHLPAVAENVESLLRRRRGLPPGALLDFELETAEETMAFWTRIARIMKLALPALVGISLLVGAIVITNLMLVSVTERTREIGLRLSIGARRRDILAQFLVESSLVAGAGAVLGIAGGVLLAVLVATLSPIPAAVSGASILGALALGLGSGVAAGVYPALRASRLEPIDALRHE